VPLPSPVLSRTAMLTGSQGDPFLGALIPALGAIGRLAVRGISRIFKGGAKAPTMRVPPGGITTGIIRPPSRTAALSTVSQIGGAILKGAGAGLTAATVGASFFGTQRAPLTIEQRVEAGLPARRRRMNVLNPKALRRATRRLSGFNRMAKKTQKELAKLAPPRARRGPGRHHHHDGHHHDS